MGRKPNALILQHFERGAKLNDSSNRYQHTCKACGEKFPKGRIDSLTAHLLKKCPAMRDQDRHKAQLEFSNMTDLSNNGNSQNGEVQMKGKTVELPIVNRTWSALETLAEVSRHFDLSEKHDDRPQQERGPGGTGTSEPSRADRLELQEQYTLDNPPVSYEQRVQREKKMGSQKLNRRESESSLSPATFAAHMSHSRSASPNLAMAATSIAAAAAARFVPSMVDPQLLGEDINGQDSMHERSLEQHLSDANASLPLPEHFFSTGSGEQQGNWPMLDGTGSTLYPGQDHNEHTLDNANPQRTGTFPHIAMNPSMTTQFSSEFGNGEKNSKPKPRSRFTTDRRKEVQTVRKLGACIRCRMLKKPCSPGTPCKTCQNVESARVWKQPCIRRKMAEELDMYSAGLHAVLAYHEVSQAKNQILFRSSTHQIETSHYPESTVYATFSALEGQQLPSEGNIDPGLSGDFSTNTLRILDNDKDDLPKIIEAYMKRMLSVFFANEISNFMKVTLNTAQQLSMEKQDVLLTRVLELWATVHILVDHELTWNISERVNIDAEPGQGPVIDRNANDGTYGLLCLQLNAAAEMKAAELCKSVLADLERRLLQRATSGSFETFLVTIILLNCVEKSTWLFKSWEQPSFKSRWPLDKTPDHFAQQGERVTNILHELLKIRHVPPKIYRRVEDGILATDADPVAREYYQKLNLSYLHVLGKQTNTIFDQSDSRCYELRFCSKLLLPQT